MSKGKTPYIDKLREEARVNLESLGYPELSRELIEELVDTPILCLRAVAQTAQSKSRSFEAMDDYIAHLEAALKIRNRLWSSNWPEIQRQFGTVSPDFEKETLTRILAAAKAHKRRLQPQKVGKNTLRADIAGKRVAILRIGNICRKAGLTVSINTESKFYHITRAVVGSVSPSTIKSALGDR